MKQENIQDYLKEQCDSLNKLHSALDRVYVYLVQEKEHGVLDALRFLDFSKALISACDFISEYVRVATFDYSKDENFSGFGEIMSIDKMDDSSPRSRFDLSRDDSAKVDLSQIKLVD